MNFSNAPQWATAHAKLNLNLHVIGLRGDGFHNLQSLVVFCGVGDEVLLEAAKDTSVDRLKLSGRFSHLVPGGTDNLVLGAIGGLREHLPDSLLNPVLVTLVKNLPIAAGIGGGSADAAAVLNLLKNSMAEQINESTLLQIATKLGADVPVCLSSAPTLMQGRGEQLRPLGKLPETHAVLVNPGVVLSTTRVFAALKTKNNPEMPELPDQFATLGCLVEWLEETRNDLFEPALGLVPQIGEIINVLNNETPCLLARMSGSGGTVFGLFSTSGDAVETAQKLSRRWPQYWCVPTSIIVE